MKRDSWALLAAALGGLAASACGGGSGAVFRGDGFTATLPSGWTISAPQSEQGATLYSSTGPNHENIAVLVAPVDAPLFAGGEAGSADLATLLQVVGHKDGSTVVDSTSPSWTTVGSNAAMEFNATVLASDGVTKTQAETIDTRYGSDVFYIFYGGSQRNYTDADSAARAMLATWKWTGPAAVPSAAPTTHATPPPTFASVTAPTDAPTAASATAPAASPTFATASFSFSSQAGDSIGQGQQQQYVTPRDRFTLNSATGEPDMLSGFRVSVNAADGEYWYIWLMPPRGQLLHTGHYDNATRAPFNGSEPGLDVTGDSRGCNTSFDSFTINTIAIDAAGAITALDMAFTQHCEQATAPTLSGRLQLAR